MVIVCLEMEIVCPEMAIGSPEMSSDVHTDRMPTVVFQLDLVQFFIYIFVRRPKVSCTINYLECGIAKKTL